MTRTGRILVALLALLVAPAAGCVIIDDDVIDRGYFRATWTLSSAMGQPLSCDAVGGDTVSYLFTDSYGQGYEDLFDCAARGGNTAPLPIDDFTLSVALLDARDDVLGQSPPLSVNLYTCDFISRDTCVKNLPLIEFVF